MEDQVSDFGLFWFQCLFHPALKLKLVIKDKYDHRINSAPIEKTFGSIEAHENTLAGAIELKKRLLKQRRKAKRDRKRAKASVLSLSQAEKQTVSTSANKIGSKRRRTRAELEELKEEEQNR